MFHQVSDSDRLQATALIEYAERILNDINHQFDLNGQIEIRSDDTISVSIKWGMGDFNYNLLVGINSIVPVLYHAEGNVWVDDEITKTRQYSHTQRNELIPELLRSNLTQILTVILQMDRQDLSLSGSLR